MNTYEYLKSLYDNEEYATVINQISELNDDLKTDEIKELQQKAMSFIDKSLLKNKGIMYSFILLKELCSIEQYIESLKTHFNIDAKYSKNAENSYFVTFDDTVFNVTFVAEQIKEKSVYDLAALNLNFNNYEEVLNTHKAYILISTVSKESTKENILNNNVDIIDRAKSFIKAVVATCHLNAVAVNLAGYTYESSEYIELSKKIFTHDLAIFNIVPITMYSVDSDAINAYTLGLCIFGKNEIEIVNYKGDIEVLMHNITNLLNKIIGEDLNLDDKDDLLIEDTHFKIEKSIGVSLPINTYKITIS